MTGSPDRNELLPGLVLPAAYEGALRRRLVDIEDASTPVNCLIAQARAEGMVECLETVTHGIPADHIERLYLGSRMPPIGAWQSWELCGDRPGGGCEHPAGAGQHPPGA